MASEKNPFLIEYTVGLNYITPAVRQKIGVAGNHNAVELEFKVDEALCSQMQNFAGAENVYFRFEIYNAAAEIFRTESQNVDESEYSDYQFYYKLQERDTRYGGTVKVVLVLTADDGSGNVEEVFCPPALLQLVGRPHGTSEHSYTELEQKALRAADDAAEAADYVRQIKEAYDSGELKGEKGDPGKDYVLTDEDRVEIARIVSGSSMAYEKYFDIDADGLVSLKPEYRGYGYTASYFYAISDNGLGVEGSKNDELPERIVIPSSINGVQVKGFQKYAFCGNHKIKEIILPTTITTITNGLFRDAINLESVKNTEQITEILAGAFWCTRIKEIYFPNLTSLPSGNVFRNCSRLERIDLGKITSIPDKTFMFCDHLIEIIGGQNITSIGSQAFVDTRKLKELHFIDKVTKIGTGTFYRSACNLDSLPSNCTGIDNYSTYKQYNSKANEWAPIDASSYVCKNPLKTLFHQNDPRWSDLIIEEGWLDKDGNVCTYGGNGCSLIVLAEIYSAFENIHLDSPIEFVQILRNKGISTFKGDTQATNNYNPRSKYGWCNIAEKLGYTTTLMLGTITAQNVEAIYSSLKNGALVYRSIGGFSADGKYTPDEAPSNFYKPDSGHAILGYGVYKNGEMLTADSSSECSNIGVYENLQSSWHLWKHGSEECDVVIVQKAVT